AVFLIGLTYGWRLGGVTVALYLLEGALGLPVFSGGKGGTDCLHGTNSRLSSWIFSGGHSLWVVCGTRI
ncbi:MAG: biotin transporter BioY, partial [SAR324 cluster bacterium]|nr:biotin transporter BioY [SAR324 cluster bacterium]